MDINENENKEKNRKINQILNTNIDLIDYEIKNENNDKEVYISNIDDNANSTE